MAKELHNPSGGASGRKNGLLFGRNREPCRIIGKVFASGTLREPFVIGLMLKESFIHIAYPSKLVLYLLVGIKQVL